MSAGALVWSTGFALLLAVACCGAGGRLAERWLPSHGGRGARLVVGFAIGNALLSYVLTLLGVVGWLRPGILTALLVFAVAAAIPYGWRLARRGAPARPDRVGLMTIGLALLFAVPAILMALAPPFLRDSLVYHLNAAREFLRSGSLALPAGNFYFAFPKGEEILLAWPLALAGDRAAQLFGVIQHLGAVAGIYYLVRQRYRRETALVCALGYAAVPAVVVYAGGAYVEPAMSLSLVAALLALAALDERAPTARAVLVGLPAGWLIALKYTGLLYAGLLGLLLLLTSQRAGGRQRLAHLAAASLAALPGLFWLGRNLAVFGNPVYPFAYRWFGGAGWDVARAAAYDAFLKSYGMGRSLVDYLALPFRFALAGEFDSMHFDGYLGPGVLLLLIANVAAWYLVRRSDRRPLVPGLGGALIVAIGFFVFGTQQARFYFLALLLSCIHAAPALDLALDQKRRAVRLAVVVVLAAAFCWQAYHLVTETVRIGAYRPVLCGEGEDQFLARRVPPYPAIQFINRRTPPGSRVLAVQTGNYGYYAQRAWFSDAFIEDHTLRTVLSRAANGADAIEIALADGFTHLLINARLLLRNLNEQETAKMRDLLANDRANVVYYDDTYLVIALHSAR